MKTTVKQRMQSQVAGWLGVMLVALLAVVVPTRADNSIQVNTGESVLLSAENFNKLAVADPAIADVVALSEKELSIIGKKAGVTTLTIVRSDAKATTVYRIEVINDTVVQMLTKLINQPSVSVRAVGDSIVLEGQVADELESQRAVQIATASKAPVVNLLEIQKPRQIRIRTKVAEVSSEALKSVGFRWFGPAGDVQFAVDWNKGTGWLMGMTQPQSSAGQTPTRPNVIDVGAEVVLQLLETKGFAKLMAEPTLLAYSGQEASFLVGQEIPIVQQLPQSFNVTYKEVGVRMNIKPTADSHNRINTKIHSEVSQVIGTEQQFGTPIIGSKKADTVLQVSDGQTIVIGGLLENNIDQDILRKVPWMADIPIFGVLFRHKTSHSTQREVVFFMTPEVVQDVDANAKTAAQTPLMKAWTEHFNPKDVLVVPNPNADWNIGKPGRMGWPESKPATAKPASKPAAAAAQNEPAQPTTPAKEPTTNFAPANPAAP